MQTIRPIGTISRAGSKESPATYQIRACPSCYGVLPWRHPKQTKVHCFTCGEYTYMIRYEGPIGYAQEKIRSTPFSLQTILVALWALTQYLDHYLKLRKILLYLFMRVISYL